MVDEAAEFLSTSESIVVALAFGRADLLPREYDDFPVGLAAPGQSPAPVGRCCGERARWIGRDEGGVCCLVGSEPRFECGPRGTPE